MESETPELLQFVLSQVWRCLDTTPGLQKNPLFARFMQTLDDVQVIAATADVTFAPGLLEILTSDTPPGVDMFKSLPTDTTSRWAVYALVLEKAGHRSRIYVGVCTNATIGVNARFKHYDDLKLLPRYVRTSLEEGFEIVTKGLLCWTSLPLAGVVPIVRLLFYALEATFACLFWAMRCSRFKDMGMGHMSLWERDTLDWDGLCSHSALNDGIAGDFDLSPEDLEMIAIEKEKKARAMKAWSCRNYQQKQMETNYHEFMDNSCARVKKSRALQPAKHRATEAKRNAKVKERKDFWCERCSLGFTRRQHLDNHLQSDGHQVHHLNRWKCAVCPNKTFTSCQGLCQHKRSKIHKDTVAAAAALVAPLN